MSEMKRLFAVLTLIVLGVLAQACGSSEKCPAYSQVDTEQAGARG